MSPEVARYREPRGSGTGSDSKLPNVSLALKIVRKVTYGRRAYVKIDTLHYCLVLFEGF